MVSVRFVVLCFESSLGLRSSGLSFFFFEAVGRRVRPSVLCGIRVTTQSRVDFSEIISHSGTQNKKRAAEDDFQEAVRTSVQHRERQNQVTVLRARCFERCRGHGCGCIRRRNPSTRTSTIRKPWRVSYDHGDGNSHFIDSTARQLCRGRQRQPPNRQQNQQILKWLT